MAYFGANIIEFFFWLFFFFFRKDLRKEMLLMSFLATPLALFDVFFVPLYWKPVTFFHIPVGVEGFLYSFLTGGIAAVIYTEITKRIPVKISHYHKHFAIIALLLVPVIFFVLTSAHFSNVMIDMYIALLCGDAVIFYFRKDLLKSSLVGGLAFGCLYFVFLIVWTTLFHEAKNWFTVEGLPKVYIFNAPLYEILFGVFFASFWGNLYELFFGYRFKRRK